MHAKLKDLLANGLELDLSPPGRAVAKTGVGISSVSGVSGQLSTTERGTSLPEGGAERLELAWLRLSFGSVRLQCAAETELRGVSVQLELPAGDPMQLKVESRRLTSPQLTVRVGTIDISAHVEMQEVELTVAGSAGSVSARRVSLNGFQVGLTGVNVLASTLECKQLTFSWGDDGFRLQAQGVACLHLDVSLRGTVIRAVDLVAKSLEMHDADIAITDLGLGHLETRMDLVEAPTEVDAPAAGSHASAEGKGPGESNGGEAAGEEEVYEPVLPIFDWRVLDSISGTVNVDLGVVIKLPVLSRRATHELRVPIRGGIVDYRELERDLSALEDALLDFSVRDGHLVLELGLPLLPTRGFGKPLVKWKLSESDERLAHERRVRLATLVQPQSVDESERPSAPPPADPRARNKPSTLRELAMRNLDITLAVDKQSHPLHALIKSLGIEELCLTGDVVHSASERKSSKVLVRLRGLDLELDDFPLNGRRFDLGEFRIDSIPSAVVQFQGVKPVRFELGCEGISSTRVALGRFAL